MLHCRHIEDGGQTPSWKLTMCLITICNMGFYLKIRNDITDSWIGLKDLQNKQKKNIMSLLRLYLYSPASKWSEIRSSGTPPSSLFYSRPSSESSRRFLHMQSVSQCPLQMIWKFPWLQWMDSSNPVHHDSCRLACCLWHPHTSVEHLLPCTESHQVTQVEQDRLQRF